MGFCENQAESDRLNPIFFTFSSLCSTLQSHEKLYISPNFLVRRKQSCSGVIHFGECALNQSFWQLKGGKVGCNARNMLLKEREITQAEAAVTKKAAGNALCSRESVSAAKKEGEWERGFWGEVTEGEALRKRRQSA